MSARGLLLTITVALCACRTPQPTTLEALVLLPPEQRPISLVLPTPDGRHIDIADHRGIAVLVVAFTTDNMPSQALLHNVETVARAHPQDLAAIAIAGDTLAAADVNSILRTYAEVLNLHATTVVLASEAVRQGDSPLGEIAHVPTVYLVNRVGVIARKVEGYLSVAQLEALVAPALPPR